MYLTCVQDLQFYLGLIIVYIVVAIAKRTKTVNLLMRYHMDYNSLKNPMFGSLQLCQYLRKYLVSHFISIHLICYLKIYQKVQNIVFEEYIPVPTNVASVPHGLPSLGKYAGSRLKGGRGGGHVEQFPSYALTNLIPHGRRICSNGSLQRSYRHFTSCNNAVHKVSSVPLGRAWNKVRKVLSGPFYFDKDRLKRKLLSFTFIHVND